ncbi:hypothetical protein [Metakosakonia massiliensis]|uniref:DUF1795 domain-containing protein n=1 Tax=Phytobacter massiliensis TaxID=1485952 RepID=A0A6N2YSE4_9ENTR
MNCKTLLAPLLFCSVLALSACDSSNTSDETAKKGTSILDGQATMVLPEGYVRMPQELLEKKYPASQRPKEAWYVESENGKVSIAFSVTKNVMSEAQIQQFAGMMKNQMKAFSPSISDVTVNGKKMSRLEITTPAADGKIFNVMQLSSLDGKLLISSFNVTEDLKDKYTQAGKDALSTLDY